MRRDLPRRPTGDHIHHHASASASASAQLLASLMAHPWKMHEFVSGRQTDRQINKKILKMGKGFQDLQRFG